MGGKRKTTEEKLLAMASGSVRLIKKLIDGTDPKANPSVRLAAARLILSLKLDKDKRGGESSSSYESQLKEIRTRKKEK